MGERAEKARELFYKGYNCTQSVVCAFADLFGMDMETAARFADGLGGGMGRMRLTCGAVSAMSLIAGLKLSSGKPGDLKNRQKVYEAVRKMAGEFEKKNGSIVCRELLTAAAAMPKDESSKPEDRTKEYYKKRPGPGCVYDCAEIIESVLLDY